MECKINLLINFVGDKFFGQLLMIFIDKVGLEGNGMPLFFEIQFAGTWYALWTDPNLYFSIGNKIHRRSAGNLKYRQIICSPSQWKMPEFHLFVSRFPEYMFGKAGALSFDVFFFPVLQCRKKFWLNGILFKWFSGFIYPSLRVFYNIWSFTVNHFDIIIKFFHEILWNHIIVP